ncbi:XkdX family protein [Brevibacillus composti]|uniref:XkdX family protein n=1 Tax=Brevibacillus composti TaxID=2796470 RepID=A0A7T5JPW8_9BACL|nr:XkdX family protein [Brevibacillus composti]QQE75734.1 XkdX family protein [Brevibacillus composti]QUO42760.1 XkdX family protein [Brevibacillus composti]
MASRLFNYFLMCWINGTVTEQQLETAVAKGYITQEEKENILATPR